MPHSVEPIDRRRYEKAGLLVRERHYPRGYRLECHQHEASVVALAVEGSWRETCDQSHLDRWAGQLQVLPAGARHASHFARTPARVFLVEVSPTWEGHDDRIARSLAEPRTLRGNSAAAGVARRLARCLDQDDVDGGAVEEMVIGLAASLERRSPPRGRAAPPWLRRARECLDDSFLRPPAIAELAAVCGVQPGSLARAFARHYGCTPSEYVRGLRLNWAKYQLLHRDLPISRIALDAGFSDQAHFSRTFERLTGVSPGRFRRG